MPPRRRLGLLAAVLPFVAGACSESACDALDREQLLLQPKGPLLLAARRGSSPPLLAGLAGEAGPPQCNVSTFGLEAPCPAACPFSAQDGARPCYFMCVPEALCGLAPALPDEGVPDRELMVCRRCQVSGCKRCAGGPVDRCEECHWGYRLDAGSGACRFHGAFTMAPIVAAGFLGAIAMFVLFWYADLRWRRPAANSEVLAGALECRERLKLRDEDAEGKPLFPLTADVHGDPGVGGVGFLLHMDFQAFVLAWALAVLLGWLLFAALAGPEVHTIGTGPSATPRELCASIHHGRALRDTILQGKAAFVGAVYVASSAAFVAFAARQRGKFHRLDAEAPSLRRFAVLCRGFPREAGRAGLEREYQDFLEEVAGEPLEGVSIVWDRAGTPGLEELIDREELAAAACPAAAWGPAEPPTALARLEAALGLDAALRVEERGGVVEPVRWPDEDSDDDDGVEGKAAAVLSATQCTGGCYAVLHTEAARDRLVQALRGCRPREFRGAYAVRAAAAEAEPDAVQWAACGTHSRRYRHRVAVGVGVICGAILAWAALFYLPYAYYTYVNFSTTGHDVSMAASLIFTVLVLGGNQVMYLTCGFVADIVKPRLLDEKETIYTVSYTMATLLNMVLDMGVLTFSTYFGMVANSVRNDEGVLLNDLHSWEAVLESYPLQKFGGEMLCTYNVWGCFILPFVIEPLVAVYLPYHLGSLVVRSRAVPYRDAVALLACGPPDLSRYADVVMNATLMVLTLFLASGYVWMSMLALLVGLGLVYAYDRARALRLSARFRFSTDLVDVSAHRMLALPCAVLAACFVFQLRLMRAFGLSDGWTFAFTACAFAAHFSLHQCLLSCIFDARRDPPRICIATYAELSRGCGVNWFTGNKVHCLRTQYLCKDKEPLRWVGPFEVPPPWTDGKGRASSFSAPLRR